MLNQSINQNVSTPRHFICHFSRVQVVTPAFICQSLTFCSATATQPFIWSSRFSTASLHSHGLCAQKYGTLHTRQSQTYSSFGRHLKTYYFHSAYPAP